MNKQQLVAAAARRSSLTQDQVREALDALLEAITDALTSGETVALSTFGRFELQDYPARKLRRFGKPGHFEVEARQVPVFKSSATLRRRLRERHS